MFGPDLARLGQRDRRRPLHQQADFAHDAAISGDGRYVAFDGSFGGRKRRVAARPADAATGRRAVRRAATPSCPRSAPTAATSASRRRRALDAERRHQRGAGRLRARHERRELAAVRRTGSRAPCAFTLASAANGSAQGLTYELRRAAQSFEETHYGSVASGRSALSADGRKVAFVTTADRPNLAGRPNRRKRRRSGRRARPRHRQTRARQRASTTRRRNDERERAQAVAPAAKGRTSAPCRAGGAAAVGADAGATEPPTVGASISADGSTVAWIGQDVGEQAPLLAAEPRRERRLHRAAVAADRRRAAGADAPVTGGSDPAEPGVRRQRRERLSQPASARATPARGRSTPPAAKADGRDLDAAARATDYLPRLSADGTPSRSSPTPAESRAAKSFGSAEASSDLYIVDMRDGLTRVAGAAPADRARRAANRSDLARDRADRRPRRLARRQRRSRSRPSARSSRSARRPT